MYCTPFFSLAVTGRIQKPNLAVFVAEELATLRERKRRPDNTKLAARLSQMRKANFFRWIGEEKEREHEIGKILKRRKGTI